MAFVTPGLWFFVAPSPNSCALKLLTWIPPPAKKRGVPEADPPAGGRHGVRHPHDGPKLLTDHQIGHGVSLPRGGVRVRRIAVFRPFGYIAVREGEEWLNWRILELSHQRVTVANVPTGRPMRRFGISVSQTLT